MNILLNDREREIYKDSIMELFLYAPETMKRKIPRANVQQGFMLHTIKQLSAKESAILCVGSYEDTACEALMKLGYDITCIDPALNMDLNRFFNSTDKKYDIVFSTSVIEHVENDEIFIDQFCKLLNLNGYGIITCDFNDSYKDGDLKPSEDFRLYTKNDLLVRLNKIIQKNNCDIIGDIDYNSQPDFLYSGCIYSFGTLVFRKNK